MTSFASRISVHQLPFTRILRRRNKNSSRILSTGDPLIVFILEPVIVPVREPVIVPTREPVIVPAREPVIVPTLEPVAPVLEPVIVPAKETVTKESSNTPAVTIFRRRVILFLLVYYFDLVAMGSLESSSPSALLPKFSIPLFKLRAKAA